jgi:hypothetical protein
MKRLGQHGTGDAEEPISTEPGEPELPGAVEADGTAVLGLVYQVVELVRNLDDRVIDAERESHAIAVKAIEGLNLAKQQMLSAEAQRDISLVALKEFSAKLLEVEEELRRSEALLAAYELRLSTAERRANGAEELAQETEKALQRFEDAVRLHLLNPKPASSKELAIAA